MLREIFDEKISQTIDENKNHDNNLKLVFVKDDKKYVSDSNYVIKNIKE